MNRYRILFIPLIAVALTLSACEKQGGAPLPKTNQDASEKKSGGPKSEFRPSFSNEVRGVPLILHSSAPLSEAATPPTPPHRSDASWHAVHLAAAG